MDRVLEFYTKQNAWSGCAEGAVTDDHRLKAAWIEELVGPGKKRILKLGAGGGQVAAAMAALGHAVIAVELVPSLCAHAKKLAEAQSDKPFIVLQADFYTVALTGPFDVVCYFDGFGVGTDDEQRRLLKRIATWLAPTGSALIEIGTPWYPASVNGRGWTVGEAERRYNFDADNCRWLDTWWPIGQPEQQVQQSIRCYSPADLRLLIESTGLQLQQVKPGGTVDWDQRKWLPIVPLGKSMNYVAKFGLAY